MEVVCLFAAVPGGIIFFYPQVFPQSFDRDQEVEQG
jgi:hypothetical protein